MKFFSLIFLLLSFPGWAKWSVTTYNIRNFDKDMDAGKTDLTELAKIIKEVQSDVMAFEEIVNKTAFDTLIKKNLPEHQYKISECGGFGKQHLAVAFNPKTFDYVGHEEDLSFSSSKPGCGSLRPLFLVTLRHKGTKTNYTFGAVHLKAGGDDRAYAQRWKQYLKLETLSDKYSDKNLILLGDFNTTGYNIKDQDYNKFEDFISSSSLKTVSEELGCTSYWHGGQGSKEHHPSILDHIVIQDKNLKAIESVKVASHCSRVECRPVVPEELGISYSDVSDHCPVQVSFK